jgi:hypothetical protein
MKDLTPIKSNHKEVAAKVHESAEINSKIATWRFFKPSLSPARTRFKEITNWVKIGFCL